MILFRSSQWLLALGALLLSGCQTLPDSIRSQPTTQPEHSAHTGVQGSNSSSLSAQETTAEKVVAALLNAPNVVHLTARSRPVLLVDRLVNRSSDHIDTEAYTQAIYAELQDSEQFRLLDLEQVQVLRQRLDYLSHNGLVDPAKAVEFGRQAGAEYLLYGQISGAAPYRLVLRLMELESGQIEWSMQKNSLN